MIKYYTEAHIEYVHKMTKEGLVRINNSIGAVDIKKAYVYYGGMPENEITIKFPDWFGVASSYLSLSPVERKQLVNLPLCDSPEEYKIMADKLKNDKRERVK